MKDLQSLDTDQKKILRVTETAELEKERLEKKVIDEWKTYLKRTKSPDTVAAYSLSVDRPFHRWLDREGLTIFDVMPADLQSWLDQMAQTVSKSTVSLRFFGVKSLYRWMIRSGKTVVDPTYAVEIPRSQVQSKLAPREALEDEQVRALLATCDTSFDGIRAKAIISLMVYCGLRQIEVFRANVSHFDKKENRIILKVHGKGREQIDDDEFVVIPIHQEERINRWIDLRGRGGTALFTYRGKDHRRLSRDRIYDIVKDRLTEIEVRQGPHSLRHTFVTNAVESGAGGRQVQIAARHRSFDTTARYLHREQRLKFAAEDMIDYGEFRGEE